MAEQRLWCNLICGGLVSRGLEKMQKKKKMRMSDDRMDGGEGVQQRPTLRIANHENNK